MKPIVVIGLGNPLMADEGIGIRLVGRFAERAAEFPGVEFVDAGTSGMNAVHAMAGRRKAVLIDCARMGGKPGTVRRFTPDEAVSRKALSGLSLHEGDLLGMIELSRRLGECPPEVVVFGIEPQSLEPREGLSPALEGRLEEYVSLVERELK